jgi:hypothetical protein
LDLFDNAEVMHKFFEKLVRSYALDALDAAPEELRRASAEELTTFVEGIGVSPSFSDRGLGLGKDVRFTGTGVSGAALWAQGRYLHVCAFATESGRAEKPGFWTRLTRPSRRRES